tara:strand:+ start:7627 stop:9480 length:1854 start_codon:yes stop_codon:yes gene_type:complete
MRSYIALVWNEHDPAASHRASSLTRAIQEQTGPQTNRVEQDGFVLHDVSCPPLERPFIVLGSEGKSQAGAIFGTLFRKTDEPHAAMPVARLDAQSLAAIRSSGGRALLARYWGTYVAFLKISEGFAVIADPAASIPCYYTEQSGVFVIFSNLEKCRFLDRSGFSINEVFVAALLAYDKIQNGDTGLNEIGELLGGQRLLITPGGRRIDPLWDPREIALAGFDPPRHEGARLLRQTVMQVTGTWAGACKQVAVSLSGGLDSSIVLNCLARSGYAGRISAVHFRPESADGPEHRYARAAAGHAGCDLLEIPVAPDAGLPAVDDHPLTVRPNRQFLAPDLPGLLPPLQSGGGALFTGQGGDHLFRVSTAPTAFADFILQRGLSRDLSKILLETANLSGRSVWSVLKDTLPRVAGRLHVSAATAGLSGRRTLVNQHAFEGLDPQLLLPDWATHANGLPPAKFDQVSTLVHMFQVRDHVDSGGDRETVRPLMSEPLLDLCLRLPAWTLSAGGVNRGLARLAFRDVVPDLVLQRTTKGYAARFYIDRVSAHREVILSALATGELAARNLISPSEVRAFGERDQYDTQHSGSRLLTYYGIEAWLRAWVRETGKRAALPAPTREA